MNIIESLTCKFCNEIYKDPVALSCCGKNICKNDIDDLNDICACPFCGSEIQSQKLSINETLKIIIDEIELHKLKINPKYESQFKKFKEKIQIVERMHNDPENIIYDKLSELRRLVDLDRENAKLEIDKLADALIKKLVSYEIEFKSECKSKKNMDYYTKLIKSMNSKLNEYEKCLKSLRNSDKDKNEKSEEIKEEIRVLDCEISDYENKLFNYKSITYEPVKNGQKFENNFGKLVVSVELFIVYKLLL